MRSTASRALTWRALVVIIVIVVIVVIVITIVIIGVIIIVIMILLTAQKLTLTPRENNFQGGKCLGPGKLRKLASVGVRVSSWAVNYRQKHSGKTRAFRQSHAHTRRLDPWAWERKSRENKGACI